MKFAFCSPNSSFFILFFPFKIISPHCQKFGVLLQSQLSSQNDNQSDKFRHIEVINLNIFKSWIWFMSPDGEIFVSRWYSYCSLNHNMSEYLHMWAGAGAPPAGYEGIFPHLRNHAWNFRTRHLIPWGKVSNSRNPILNCTFPWERQHIRPLLLFPPQNHRHLRIHWLVDYWVRHCGDESSDK